MSTGGRAKNTRKGGRRSKRAAKPVCAPVFASDAKYIDIHELARTLGWSTYTLRKWARHNQLVGVEKWGRNYRFLRGQVRHVGQPASRRERPEDEMAALVQWRPTNA